MTTLREAAKAVLDCWDSPKWGWAPSSPTANLMAVLRAALEKQAEPVAWRTFDGEGGYDYRTYEDNEDYAAEWAKRNPRHVGWVDPLYTTPPQRKPLTDELYNELLFAVGKKYPNETRHQTALRYIRQAEMPNSEPAKAAHGIKETP